MVGKGYNMVTEQTITKLGFVKDKNNLRLKEVLKDNVELKEVHIDIYPENPLIYSTSFMLLLRAIEKNTIIHNDNNRLILEKRGKNRAYIMNILFSKISECFSKSTDKCSEFILNIQNIYYKITVFN